MPQGASYDSSHTLAGVAGDPSQEEQKAMDELLSLGRMARRLGVTQDWLRTEAEAGRVPCLKADRRLLFNPTAVQADLAVKAARVRQGVHDKPSPLCDICKRRTVRVFRAEHQGAVVDVCGQCHRKISERGADAAPSDEGKGVQGE
jgi:hypothetical protein